MVFKKNIEVDPITCISKIWFSRNILLLIETMYPEEKKTELRNIAF